MKKLLNHTLSMARTFILIAIPIITITTFMLLCLYMFEFSRPVKLIDIKVPVSTTQNLYSPGDDVFAIFFGEVFYNGEVLVKRQVFCDNFRGSIKPDAVLPSQPAKLNGITTYVGKLPMDTPIDENCIIQFINIYQVDTVFGHREEAIPYYTQSFRVVSPETKQKELSE